MYSCLNHHIRVTLFSSFKNIHIRNLFETKLNYSSFNSYPKNLGKNQSKHGYLLSNKCNINQQLILFSTSSRKVFFTWKSFIISGVLMSMFAGYLLYLKNEKMIKMERQRKKAMGEVSVGGSFDLVDHNNKKFTSLDLQGQWALIYFGFTHCPDVCPDELEKIVKALDLIESNKQADSLKALFITVDPERDSIDVVREYIREFSPKLIGLTGTKEQIENATRAYRVYFSAGPRDKENDYIVDHTIITYLINPEGQLTDYYGQTKTAEDMANGIVNNMKKYRSINRKLGFL